MKRKKMNRALFFILFLIVLNTTMVMADQADVYIENIKLEVVGIRAQTKWRYGAVVFRTETKVKYVAVSYYLSETLKVGDVIVADIIIDYDEYIDVINMEIIE